MNLQHGFYSKSTSINPDARMIQVGALRSAELAMLVDLMDNERITVGQLIDASLRLMPFPRPQGVDTLKSWLWWLCEQIENQFDYESAQAKYANMVALMGSAIEEFQLDTGARLYAYVIENPEPNSLSQMQYHMNSVMTKIKKLRVKF